MCSIFKLAADQVLFFLMYHWLKPDYYTGEQGESTCKDRLSVQIKPWHVFDFSINIFWHNRLLESPWYIAYVISTIFGKLWYMFVEI